jgi:dynein light chain roadblock-type
MASTTAAPADDENNSTVVNNDTLINLQEMQETVSRLSSHKGVQMVLILNRNGDILVESGITGGNSLEHASNIQKLLTAANTYLQQCVHAEDEVAFLQIRSKDNHDLMISPHEGFVLAVLKR